MKIMITGGFGFVGSHLSEALIKHHNLILLTRSKNKWKNIEKIAKKITIEYTDITNFSKLENSIKKHKPDVIVHLAGETSHSRSFDNPLDDVDTNAKSTIAILESIRKYNPLCKFILGSTFIVIGKPKKLPVNEETPCNPTTIYGANRLASETYCKIYHNVYGKGKSLEMKAISLIEIFEMNKIEKCDLLKLDCEGAEYEILNSLSNRYYKKINKICLEYHNYDKKQNIKNLKEKLTKLNYSVIDKPSTNEMGMLFAYSNN